MLASLEKLQESFATVAGVNAPTDSFYGMLYTWLSKESPPTWKSLYDVLEELQLQELSRQIQQCIASELSNALSYMHIAILA